jgi:S1-C subfamily serine protease
VILFVKRLYPPLFLFVFLLALVACGRSTPATATPTLEPTLSADELIATVVAEIESQLPQETATPVPTVDAGAITGDVLAEVESQMVPLRESVGLALDSAAAALAAQGIEDALIRLYQRTNPAVVYIIVPFVGSGSGFVYGADGHIVTNNHVVADGSDFEVVFANGERRRAALVGADADSDLAVIQVDELPDGVEPLPLAPADTVQVGQFVVAIGNPFGEQGSMSLGIVSALGRSLRSQRGRMAGSTYSLPEVIQTDAPINPGNSGGPLLNLDGEVVGVNAAIATLTGTNSGVGFSIPVAAVHQTVPSLIENGAYTYPYMGVGFDDEITLDEQSAYDLPQTNGAYVISVAPGGPADEAGLIPASPNTGRGGDLIIKLDDQAVNDFADLNAYLVFHTTVGQTIQVTVLREGESLVLPLTLGARP